MEDYSSKQAYITLANAYGKKVIEDNNKLIIDDNIILTFTNSEIAIQLKINENRVLNKNLSPKKTLFFVESLLCS